ncbi:MAG TPA: phage capsid protein [Lachnospiraceae bacterium]|nr:phage capsid protein [Lachnospiraceae bacterium]
MQKRYFRKRNLKPVNLQIFAGEDGAGAGDGNGGGSGGDGGDGDGGKKGGEPASFDDFLKGEGNQAEFDRRVQKAIDTAVKNAREKWQLMTDDKVSEAEKLAKMTEKEKTDYLHRKKEKELAEREARITRAELKAETRNTLAEKKLPAELADVLNYTDADSCKKSIEAVEKAFQAAVQAAVEEKLKGGKPPKGAPQDDEIKKLEEQVYKNMKGW